MIKTSDFISNTFSIEKNLSPEEFSKLLSEYLKENYTGQPLTEFTLEKMKTDLNGICDYILEARLNNEYLEIICKTFITVNGNHYHLNELSKM